MRYLRNYTSDATYQAEKAALPRPYVCYVQVSSTQSKVYYGYLDGSTTEYAFGTATYPVAPTSAVAGIAIAGSAIVGTI